MLLSDVSQRKKVKYWLNIGTIFANYDKHAYNNTIRLVVWLDESLKKVQTWNGIQNVYKKIECKEIWNLFAACS